MRIVLILNPVLAFALLGCSTAGESAHALPHSRPSAASQTLSFLGDWEAVGFKESSTAQWSMPTEGAGKVYVAGWLRVESIFSDTCIAFTNHESDGSVSGRTIVATVADGDSPPSKRNLRVSQAEGGPGKAWCLQVSRFVVLQGEGAINAGKIECFFVSAGLSAVDSRARHLRGYELTAPDEMVVEVGSTSPEAGVMSRKVLYRRRKDP